MSLALRGDRPGRAAPTLALALAGALACMLLGLPKLIAVWSTGRFFDTDDALRMVQLRDLLDGQAWSDLMQYRLNAPDGLAMHWSRVTDAPLAAMISFFEALSSDATAERLVRLVWPASLLTAWFAALIHAVRTVNGGRGGVAATLIGLGMVVTLGQFEPGRIDHHGAQILLLTIMAGAALSALEKGTRRRRRDRRRCGGALARHQRRERALHRRFGLRPDASDGRRPGTGQGAGRLVRAEPVRRGLSSVSGDGSARSPVPGGL